MHGNISQSFNAKNIQPVKRWKFFLTFIQFGLKCLIGHRELHLHRENFEEKYFKIFNIHHFFLLRSDQNDDP